MEDIERLCADLIREVTSAQTKYWKAIQYAKKKEFVEARQMIKEGAYQYIQGHKIHVMLLEVYSNSSSKAIPLLLAHAEDRLMSAESFKIVAEEFITMYARINQT